MVQQAYSAVLAEVLQRRAVGLYDEFCLAVHTVALSVAASVDGRMQRDKVLQTAWHGGLGALQ